MNDDGPAADWPALVRNAGTLGVTLEPEQVERLQRYLGLLCEWNQRFNLTAIDRPDEILVKHFLDSLTCALVVDFQRHRTLADVGTGAGFPGLVLKIAFPHLRVTLLDAVHKRLLFLERVAADLELTDVRMVHARVEDAAAAHGPPSRSARSKGAPPPAPSASPLVLRERFDLVTARAVARLNVLAEWLLPLARVGGAAVAMKGPDSAAEVEEAGRALRLLGGGEPVVRPLALPESDIGRSLILIPKVRATPPAYPRAPGAARKAPL